MSMLKLSFAEFLKFVCSDQITQHVLIRKNLRNLLQRLTVQLHQYSAFLMQ